MVLCTLLNILPVTQAEETAGIQPYAVTADIPSAKDIEHVHNSAGWQCYLTCDKEEHQHSIEGGCYNLICAKDESVPHHHTIEGGCYNLICAEPEVEPHHHTVEDGCYALTCPDTSEGHVHSVEAGCYTLTCDKQETDGHQHSLENCYTLKCDKEETDGHQHSVENGCYTLKCQDVEGQPHHHSLEAGCYELGCDKEEHTHNAQECTWVCATDYVLLTVEYYVVVDGQDVRIAETFQSLLQKDDNYDAPIAALKEKGYQVKEIQRYTQGASGNPETVPFDEAAGNYIVSGTIQSDTKINVKYEYTDELAPYQVDYWGCDANGQNEELIYSYIGKGPKDIKIPVSQDDPETAAISLKVNTLMQNLSDILSDDTLDDTDPDFLKNLVEAVDAKYSEPDAEELHHDITPLLQAIAGKDKDLDTLTLEQIKTYVDDKLQKAYGFDTNRQKDMDALGLTVTADNLAKRNLYFVPKVPQTVLFTTGVPEAKVNGIPQDPTGELGSAIEPKENAITAQADVDISAYTGNIWASHQSFLFVGWVTGEGTGVIRDYTNENALGKYSDLTIYTADGDGTNAPIPAGATTEALADALKTMPEGGATYYAVWKPFGSTYTVQLWFESAAGDNTYVESHALDIKDRMKPAAGTITFNSFDVERAQEARVIAAANTSDSALFDAVVFEDPDGGTSDSYHSYADYRNSPFYGFDFLECPVCAADPSMCGTAGCTCGHQRGTNADGSEGAATSVRACNYQPVEVNASGDTILNLYYTRETWEIVLNPNVSLWTVECLERPTELNPYTYWIGGKREKDIKNELEAEPLDPVVTIQGKYGVSVPEGYNNGIGEGSDPGNVGSKWAEGLWGNTFATAWIPSGTNILLANGSEAFQQSDKGDETTWPHGVKRESGCYIYPQDTRTYIDSYYGEVAEPKDWLVPFNCLSTIDPGMFTDRTAEPDADTASGYTRIQKGVAKWEGYRFDQESSYDLTTGKHTYGTHRLNIYPYFHGISDDGAAVAKHTFKINYYLQALPHEEASAPYTYNATNGDKIAFVRDQQITVESPASLLNYGASTPAGMVPLMWRTAPNGFSSRGKFQGTGMLRGAERYTKPQIESFKTVSGKSYAMTPMTLSINDAHNASFNEMNRRELNGNSIFLSDWRQLYAYNRPTQTSATLASMIPSNYWVSDWIRVGDPEHMDSSARLTGTLTGSTGLYNLIDQANAGDASSITLLDQLESSVIVGSLFPYGSNERIYNHRSNINAFRYSSNGQFNTTVTLANCKNAIAFARNEYTITYNTCYLNDDGVLVREPDGSIRTTEVHTTKYLKGSDNVITDKRIRRLQSCRAEAGQGGNLPLYPP